MKATAPRVFDIEIRLVNKDRAMKKKRVKSPEVEAVGAEEGEHERDADLLVAMSEEAELFHTLRGESYATVAVRGHAEAMSALSSRPSPSSRATTTPRAATW